LSALRLITYGSEPMPPTTLARLRAAFPSVELRQTYGLIELGVLRAKSESSDSLWVKVGGEGYDLRVVDGILQIKAASAMLGYLNAASPFTQDGYFITGDRVELNGEYMRFLGRESELINVGGQKVFPGEVESVLLESDLVEEAAACTVKSTRYWARSSAPTFNCAEHTKNRRHGVGSDASARNGWNLSRCR
jgi:acyl-CoA synthetase (AMP-forming)/AMP-acid ligase II